MKNKKILSVTQTALLCAVAVVLSILESLIPPMPMLPPGAKLGLSNLANMVGVSKINLSCGITVAIVKALFAGVTRGFTAMMMSLVGGVLSTLVMGIFLKVKNNPFSFIGIGILGAISHNIGQLCVAIVLTSRAVITYAPFLLLFGLLTGSLTGIVLKLLLNRGDAKNL